MARQRPHVRDRIFKLEADPVGHQSPAAAPSEAAIQIGQKLMSLELIKAPIATNAPQAGINRERKASDSPNASANTIGAAQTWLLWTKSTVCWTVA